MAKRLIEENVIRFPVMSLNHYFDGGTNSFARSYPLPLHASSIDCKGITLSGMSGATNSVLAPEAGGAVVAIPQAYGALNIAGNTGGKLDIECTPRVFP